MAKSIIDHRLPLIVQARARSTRFPGKVLQPFAEGLSLLEFQLTRLERAFPGFPIVVATSANPADDPIERTAAGMEVGCYRGDEQDVLKRFVDCCQEFGFTGHIVRICADNPFLQMEFLSTMVKEVAAAGGQYDYIGFSVNGIPAIKTHFGFFAESVDAKALSRVNESVKETVFHEHVTNYIYESTGQFNVRLLEITPLIPYLKSLRLTVDSREDMETAIHVYGQLHHSCGQTGPGWKDIVALIEKDPGTRGRMTEQINLYHK